MVVIRHHKSHYLPRITALRHSKYDNGRLAGSVLARIFKAKIHGGGTNTIRHKALRQALMIEGMQFQDNKSPHKCSESICVMSMMIPGRYILQLCMDNGNQH